MALPQFRNQDFGGWNTHDKCSNGHETGRGWVEEPGTAALGRWQPSYQRQPRPKADFAQANLSDRLAARLLSMMSAPEFTVWATQRSFTRQWHPDPVGDFKALLTLPASRHVHGA